MKDRINQFLAHESISPAEFADKIGVQRSSVSHVLNGRNYPSAAFIQKMLGSYQSLNPRWLLLGVGTMFESKTAQANEPTLFQISDPQEGLKSQGLTPPEIQSPLKDQQNQKSGLQGEVAGLQSDSQRSLETIPPHPVSELLLPGSPEKEVERIVMFYRDKTFTAYTPSK
ncbi:MAG: helix-turn-helix transcriptional regulator [Mariniphaga sp.]